MKAWRFLVPVLTLAMAACGGSGNPSSDDVVAMAGGFELTAEAVADILAPQTELQNGPEVVEALTDLWTQYFLLARAAGEDTTLANLDLSPLLDRQVEQELVFRLREQVIQVDTALTDEELQSRYEETLPGGRLSARHILFQFPVGASDAQADSVRALAESIRSRLLAGEEFEALARSFSQDAGSADQGGDLGSFGRGEMVRPFEEAAFALEEGEVSEVVETPQGLHLIRVDERVIPPLEEGRDQFRLQIQTQIVAQAESTYVADLVAASDLEIDPEVFESVKQVAADPQVDLSPRASGRALASFRGGAFTLGEFQEWLLASPPNVPPQIQAAPDPQIDVLLRNLARSDLLVEQARAEGISIPQARKDTITTGLLDGIKGIAGELGFMQVVPESGESLDVAADRTVREILVQVVQEGRQAYPLQSLAIALKAQYGAQVYQSGVLAAVELITSRRALLTSRPSPVLPGAAPPAITTPPDTSGIEQ